MTKVLHNSKFNIKSLILYILCLYGVAILELDSNPGHKRGADPRLS